MKKVGAFLVFLVLLSSDSLGISFSLGPGLSLKNAFLYLMVVWIALEAVLDARDGGFLHRRIDYVPLHAAFIALIGLATLSSLASVFVMQYPGYSLMTGALTLKGYAVDHYLMLFVFLAALRTAEECIWMVKAMLVALTVTNVMSVVDMYGLVDLGIVTPRSDGRLQGPLGGANAYGSLMAFYLPPMAAFWYLADRRARVFWAFAMLMCLAVMLLTTSRGAVVGLAAGVVGGVFLARRHVKASHVARAMVGGAVLGAVALSVVMAAYGDLLYERYIETSFSGGLRQQTSGRIGIWGGALALMSADWWSWIFGFGWATFGRMNGIASHNIYIEYLFQLGIPGLFVLVLVLLLVVRYLVNALDFASGEQKVVLMGFLFGYLSFTACVFFSDLSSPWLYVWALTGVMLRLAVLSLEPSEENEAAVPARTALVSVSPQQ